MATINSFDNQVLDASVTLNGGIVNIGSDLVDNAINIGTGANGGRTTTIGSTTADSSMVLASGGTGLIAMNGGLSVDSIGRNINSAQPCFKAFSTNTLTGVGSGGADYQIPYDNVTVNQGSYFDTATGYFTAPVGGVYLFGTSVLFSNMIITSGDSFYVNINVGPSYGTAYYVTQGSPTSMRDVGGFLNTCGSMILMLSQGQVVSVHVAINSEGFDLPGGDTENFFWGYLVC